MKKNNVILIGTSIMLEKCIEISVKNFKKVYVISKDKNIKKKFQKKIKIISLNKIKNINCDYLFSILNEKILPPRYLKYIKKFSLNFHDGPLPKYAGLFSSTWSIANNEKVHGVCWHKIEKTIDTGDILIQKKFSIKKSATAYEVDAKGIIEGVKLFKKIVNNIKNDFFKFEKQKLKQRSYFGKQDLKKILKKFIKNKKNKILLRAFTVSSDKEKILFKYFGVKISRFKKANYSNKLNLDLTNEDKLKKLINFINKTIKTDFKFERKKLHKLKEYSLNSHPKWDSLAHVKLLSNIEKKFNISITEKNISNFNSVQLIFNAIFDKI